MDSFIAWYFHYLTLLSIKCGPIYIGKTCTLGHTCHIMTVGQVGAVCFPYQNLKKLSKIDVIDQ